MKLTTKLLVLLVLLGGLPITGCGPQADPQNASGENQVIDEEAYAAEMAASEAAAAKEIGEQ
jgi:hypothetical protein